jgi:hypothetical protein
LFPELFNDKIFVNPRPSELNGLIIGGDLKPGSGNVYVSGLDRGGTKATSEAAVDGSYEGPWCRVACVSDLRLWPLFIQRAGRD